MIRYLLCVLALVGVLCCLGGESKACDQIGVTSFGSFNTLGVQRFGHFNTFSGVQLSAVPVHAFNVSPFFVQANPVVIQQRAVVRQRVLRAPRQRSLSIQRTVIR